MAQAQNISALGSYREARPVAARLRRQAVKLRRRLGIKSESPFAHDEVDGVGFSELEHLIHELAHAVLLRLEIDPPTKRLDLEEDISVRLKGHSPASQAHQEACAWIIEYHVICALGHEDRMCWGDCVGEACIQTGVTADLMHDAWYTWSDELKQHAERICVLLGESARVEGRVG